MSSSPPAPSYKALPSLSLPHHHPFPSPPLSVAGASDAGVPSDFDIDSLVDLASASATTSPQSEALVSPKTATAPGSAITASSGTAFTFDTATGDLVSASDNSHDSTAAALSKHHFERYLHYRALAAHAQAELSLSYLDSGLMGPTDDHLPPLKQATQDRSNNNSGSMLAAMQQQPSFGGPGGATSTPSLWNTQIFTYQQQQQQAQQAQQVFHAQAQAQAHFQAAQDAAQVQAVAAAASQRMYYMPQASRVVGADALSAGPQQHQQANQPPPLWSRHSGNTSVSATSPPFPSTPTYASSNAVASATESTGPSFASGSAHHQHSHSHSHSHHQDEEEDELDFGSPDESGDLSSSSLSNMNGGGRGYIPGKTPDDPKKRHKCHVCGRGFARAFNLKSHVQTHDPLRPKPHMCPHPMCKRSFSRLHDLERHRQGIHSDGPLVDAKRQGVSPSVVRAQSRMQRRAEAGGLI